MRKRMNVKKIGVAIVAVVAIAITVAVLGKWGYGQKPGARRPYLTQKNAATSAVKPYSRDEQAGRESGDKTARKGRAVSRFASANPDGVFRDSDGKPYPKADQAVMAAAAAAIENDDLKSALELAKTALTSDNRDLREAVVDALGWFGAPALTELLPFMADPDSEVAESAQSNWLGALQELSDDGMKAGIIEMTVKVLRDKDIMENVANELIGMDELAAVQVIANLVEEGGEAATVAKEVYDSITGEEWKDVDSAESWLQENYTPPDKE